MKSIALSTASATPPELPARAHRAKLAARCALGFVWLYEGLVPKIFFPALHPDQTDLVARSGLYWPTPELTLIALGLLQAALGLMLLTGWRERLASALATLGMLVLIVLVAWGRPDLLTDPFGALAKDACLLACAGVVWLLSARPGRGDPRQLA